MRLFKGLGFHLRRQYPIANYVVDFAGVSAGLVIEIDEPTHDDQLAEAAERQAFLERLG
jgi:very-short-patch-repair endonuclease